MEYVIEDWIQAAVSQAEHELKFGLDAAFAGMEVLLERSKEVSMRRLERSKEAIRQNREMMRPNMEYHYGQKVVFYEESSDATFHYCLPPKDRARLRQKIKAAALRYLMRMIEFEERLSKAIQEADEIQNEMDVQATDLTVYEAVVRLMDKVMHDVQVQSAGENEHETHAQAAEATEREMRAGNTTTVSKFLCKMCSIPHKNIVKLWCGHSFCRKCIMDHAKKESQYCPDCGFELCLDLYFPFSIPPEGFEDKDVCFWCRKEGPKGCMKVCGGCQDAGDITTYCSEKYQRADWVVHKKTACAHWKDNN